MRIIKLHESGHKEALLGLSLSYNRLDLVDIFVNQNQAIFWEDEVVEKMLPITKKLSLKDGGHNKFLESVQVWLVIQAPRYWWQQADTYRVGNSKQSESTMHTILKRPLNQQDFEYKIPRRTLMNLNMLIDGKHFDLLKNNLPEGFLQWRVWNLNYKCLRNICKQRANHKLRQWRQFIDFCKTELNWHWAFNDISLQEKYKKNKKK